MFEGLRTTVNNFAETVNKIADCVRFNVSGIDVNGSSIPGLEAPVSPFRVLGVMPPSRRVTLTAATPLTQNGITQPFISWVGPDRMSFIEGNLRLRAQHWPLLSLFDVWRRDNRYWEAISFGLHHKPGDRMDTDDVIHLGYKQPGSIRIIVTPDKRHTERKHPDRLARIHQALVETRLRFPDFENPKVRLFGNNNSPFIPYTMFRVPETEAGYYFLERFMGMLETSR